MKERPGSRSWIVPLVGLLVITFTVCTSELVIAGLLPTIAADLRVDIPMVGLLITAYALGVAVAGPLLSLATARVDRKTLLLGIVAVFIAGNGICALAPDYTTLLLARLLMSGCHGLFFGLAVVLAGNLAPRGRQGSAVSMVFAGVSVAIILGVPLGTAIGHAFGWRATFGIIAIAGAGACLAVAWLIPAEQETEPASDLSTAFRAATRLPVLICYVTLALPLIAFFALLSYAVPLLTDFGGVPLVAVPLILFVLGLASFFGSLIGGWLADRRPIATLAAIMTIDTALFVALSLTASDSRFGVTLLVAIWLVSFALPPALQSRVLAEATDAPSLAATLMNTASQIGIALGAAFGGFVISQGWGYDRILLLGAPFWLLGLLGVAALAVYDRRPKDGTTPKPSAKIAPIAEAPVVRPRLRETPSLADTTPR